MKNKLKFFGVAILAIVVTVSIIAFVFRQKLVAPFIPIVEQFGEIHVKVKNDTSYVNTKLIVTNRSFLKIEIDTVNYKVSCFDKTYLQNKKFLGLILRAEP